MDIEAKISSLKSFVKLGSQGDKPVKSNNDYHSSSDGNSEKNGFWNSFSSKAQEPDPWLPGLTKTQRIVGFCLFLILGMFCFGMAAMIIPFILLKSRKFVALYTMGSVFTLGSIIRLWNKLNVFIGLLHCIFMILGHCLAFNGWHSFLIYIFSLLWGPYHHFKHLVSVDRLPFTAAYFGSMFATLYVAIFMKSTILTLVCAVIQVITLLWYIVSYIPGGTAGMKMISRFFSSTAMKTVSNTLPV